MDKKLINYIAHFQLLDLLGFANILQVPENDDFEEFLTDIIVAFNSKPRKIKKELLKLARQVSEENLKDKVS